MWELMSASLHAQLSIDSSRWEGRKREKIFYQKEQQTSLEKAIFLSLEGFTWKPWSKNVLQRRWSQPDVLSTSLWWVRAADDELAGVLCWPQARAQPSHLPASHTLEPHQVMGWSWPRLSHWAEVSGQGYSFFFLTQTTPLFGRAVEGGLASLILLTRLLNVLLLVRW